MIYMSEIQNIEYKSSWHDDYLKWICGFANAQGGKIYIGKDDDGKVVDVANFKDLMEEIPNKIKNNMGITAEVNLLQEDGKYYIGIIVVPYSVAISLRGRYYYRCGSVKQELTGAALSGFLLKRTGHTWDDVIGKAAELPEPELIERDGGFLVTLIKDKYSEEELRKIELNERQIKAVQFVKEKGKITNSEYQEINIISRRTATDELMELVTNHHIFVKRGTSGSSIYYEIVAQLLRNLRNSCAKSNKVRNMQIGKKKVILNQSVKNK